LHSLPIQNKQVECTVKKEVLFPLIRRSVTLPPHPMATSTPARRHSGRVFLPFCLSPGDFLALSRASTCP